MIDRTHNASASAKRIADAIANASSRTGVSFDYLMRQARVESGMRPDARASTSSATGLYQFTRQTWLGTLKQHGAAHGLGWASNAISRNDGAFSVADANMRARILDLRTSPEAAAAMAAEFANDNRVHLQSRFGEDPDPTDLYLAHFLGADGASRFLDAYRNNPEIRGAALFPDAARANRAVFYRADGSARSISEIRENFAAKLGETPLQPPPAARHISRKIRIISESRAPLDMARMEPMPKRLDLDFARNAYRRLSGLSA